MPRLRLSCVRTAARRITQAYDVALAGTGLRATQFSLLVTTHHLGTPTIEETGPNAGLRSHHITRNVQGLIKRRRSRFPGRDGANAK